MAKLKPKRWMTLAQAARHLTDLSESQTVTDIDILQHAIEGDLMLSLKFTQVPQEKVWSANMTPEQECTHEELEAHWRNFFSSFPSGDILRGERQVMSLVYKNHRYIGTRREQMDILSPGPLCDINLNGENCDYFLEIWRRYQTGEIKALSTLPQGDKDIVKRYGEEVDRGPFLELVPEEIGIFLSMPTHNIPEETYLVVRPEELHKLIEEAPTAQKSGPLTTREKNTYLRVIRALCEEHRDIDLIRHSTSASQIIAIADALDLGIPSQRTLEKLLKEARDLED